MRASSFSLLLALLTVLSACAGPDATPEQQIRALLGEIERASRAARRPALIPRLCARD